MMPMTAVDEDSKLNRREAGAVAPAGGAVIKNVNVGFEPDGDGVLPRQFTGLGGHERAAARSQYAGFALKQPFHDPGFAGTVLFFAETF